ncbi:unnamed protein product [Acanthoscelides obtectus]|uniref:Uncharacterized protein n=1 Tax=Acanthoscelides obtectus TaxID=200917 RepID=A0A9P0PPS6_ACAOB|nr:unnamed protein product [Acanthoscelides obtectus]CAK1627334.1 hypothetical protein AOBTE_LOCUS4527 [Acanthoscelides obtectus]
MGDWHQEQTHENRLRKRWRDGNKEIRNKTGKLMNCPVSYVRLIFSKRTADRQGSLWGSKIIFSVKKK